MTEYLQDNAVGLVVLSFVLGILLRLIKGDMDK